MVVSYVLVSHDPPWTIVFGIVFNFGVPKWIGSLETENM